MSIVTKYSLLSARCDEHLKRSARFVRAAFHVHSPQSYDWAQRPSANGAINNREQFLNGGAGKFLDHLEKHFDIVCITDHMRSAYACELAAAAAARGTVAILPGMEVNCKIASLDQRVHLLAIFPAAKSVAEIDRIFASHADFPGEDKRNGQEDFHLTSLRDFVQIVEKQGGMMIVAHIDESSRGHRARFRASRDQTLSIFAEDAKGTTIDEKRQVSEEYKRLLADSGVRAIEVMKTSDRSHYVRIAGSDGKQTPIACVVRSDPHCVEDFADPEIVTYVKVSRPDFDCLRDAMTFSETRLRFRENLPTAVPNRMVGIRLVSPSREGFFHDTTIAFNENLNALIGARGSGKSTVIEALRYVLGQNEFHRAEADQSGQPSYRDISMKIQTANLCDTLIEVVYERGGTRHCLSCAFDGKSTSAVEVFDLDGTPRLVSAAAMPLEFPARIYSWGEIENLGRRPSLQRSLLDRAIPQLTAYLREQETSYLALAAIAAELRATAKQLAFLLAENRGLLKRYREFRTDFERVNTPEVAKLFLEVDVLRARESVLLQARAALVASRERIAGVDSELAVELDAFEALDDESIKSWWDAEVAPRLTVPAFRSALHASFLSTRQLIEARIQAIDDILAPLSDSLKLQQSQLREQARATPEEELSQAKREQARLRWQEVAVKRENYLKQFDHFALLKQQREVLVDQIRASRSAIALERRSSYDEMTEKLGRFAIDDAVTEIEMHVGSDRSDLVDQLRERGPLSRDNFGQYRSKQVAERCCATADPLMIVDAGFTGDPMKLFAFPEQAGTDGHLSADEAGQLARLLDPFVADIDADVIVVDVGRLDHLIALEQVRWDDTVRIRWNGRPVDELSPGQRSGAMFPVVALSEDVPLVIDQPEDNLDNRHVGSVLTRILADLKERRQIIVATHSPNIVVGGDAEQVVVLSATDARAGSVVDQGSIDDPEIIKSVIAIMEGGADAFRARETRYSRFLT